jgi:hypothetical protein
MDIMKLKIFLYSSAFYILSVVLYISYFFLFSRDSPEVISSLFFGIPLFFIMLILSHTSLKADKQDLLWKIPVKNFNFLFISGLGFSLLFYVFSFFLSLYFIIGILFVVIYVIISLFYSTLLSWGLYKSEKIIVITIILLISLGSLISFIIFYNEGFCDRDNGVCLTQKALDENDLSYCKIQGVHCYIVMAIKSKNVNVCNNLRDSVNVDECYSNYNFNINNGTYCKNYNKYYTGWNC